MNASYGLAGKTVMVTGAAQGIGLAIARAFAAQGCRLLAVDRNADALAIAHKTFTGAVEVTPLACDLGNKEQLDILRDRLQHDEGCIEVLVNNAGVEYPTPINAASSEAQNNWSALLHNNVSGMSNTISTLLPLLCQGASIINQASIWGLSGEAGFSAYVASKHAVIGLTRSLALELAPRGIRVNAVCPGWIRTDAAMRSLSAMARSQGRPEAEVMQSILATQAIPQLLEPEDIAGVYLFLASRDARSITGQSIVASNGAVMH
jgi:NAD(P)-dependent dehydrogenase (short-subunit alcohol dehydrogenase family)